MSHPPHKANTSRYVSTGMLTRLGQVTGQRFDLDRLRHLTETVFGRADGDPIAHLAIAAEELGLRVTPVRMPLSEAVWQARKDSPVVFWCEAEQRFLIVSSAGAFNVRLALYDEDEGETHTISRARFARRLGLAGVNEIIEIGLIHSQSPESRAGIHLERNEEEQAARYATRTHRKVIDEKLRVSGATHAHHHMPPFRRFLKILHPERKDIALLLIFAMFSGILYLALPLAVDTVVTNLAFGGQTKPYLQALLVVAKILALCLCLQGTIIAFQYYIAEIIQRRIFVRTAAELAFRLPRVKAEAFDGLHGPELVNRFLDVVTVQKNTAFFLLEGVNVVAASLIGMLLLALYHPLLLGFVALLIFLIFGVTWLLGRRAVQTAVRESRSKYDLVSWFEEIAAYPFMFKGLGGYEIAYQRTNLLATEFIQARKRHFSVVFRQVLGLLILSAMASVSLLILGTWLVLSQQITLGQLVASELIMSGIVIALIKLGKKLESWYDTMAATDKLGHLFDLEIESTSGEEVLNTDKRTGMNVEARGLGFSYAAGQKLFSGKDFSIPAGSHIALYGPQGSGVSSLLDLLFAVRQPTEGHLSFDGLDSRNWQLERLRESVQLLRRDEFIDGTIIENLRLGRSDVGMDEIRKALSLVGLLDEVLCHPDGMNQRLRIGGAPLSTSQRIGLLFARAVVQEPRLLLIDELFDGLDEETFRRLHAVVFKSGFSWTVIVATRMQEVIQICDGKIELTPRVRQRGEASFNPPD